MGPLAEREDRLGRTSQGATSATFEPTLAEDEGNYIRATASYTDGEGWQDGRKGVAAGGGRAAGELGAGVPDDGDRAARGGGGHESGNVGAPVAATDFDNDTLYYSLSGTDAATSTIGIQNTGSCGWRRV